MPRLETHSYGAQIECSNVLTHLLAGICRRPHKTQTMRHVAAHPSTWTGQWLRRARITDDPAGDLIADMCRESDYDSSATSRPCAATYAPEAHARKPPCQPSGLDPQLLISVAIGDPILCVLFASKMQDVLALAAVPYEFHPPPISILGWDDR